MRKTTTMFVAAAGVILSGTSQGLAEEINCPRNIINRTVDNVFVNGTCTIRNSTVKGNIVVAQNGNLLVQGTTIRGSVQSEGATRILLLQDPMTGRDTRVVGDVQIKNTIPGSTSSIADAHIGGTILYDDNTAPLNLFRNDVNGDVQIFQNTRVVRIRDNTIDGNLQCKQNFPRPINGGGNVVGGNAEDQCARFAN